MKKISRYRCGVPGCFRTYASMKNALKHMETCWRNPERRACLTCYNYDDYDDCRRAQEIDEDELTMITNCSQWKIDDDIDTNVTGPKEVIRFACKNTGCLRKFRSEKSCAEHEKDCLFNKDKKSCASCKHSITNLPEKDGTIRKDYLCTLDYSFHGNPLYCDSWQYKFKRERCSN